MSREIVSRVVKQHTRRTLKNSQPRKSDNRTYQFKICLWLALRKTTVQVRDLLNDRCNIDMSVQNIDSTYRYAPRWKPIITYLRERFLRNISRIPIANKAYRLWLLNEAAVEALTWHTKSIGQYGSVKEKKIGTLAVLTREARAEIEGDKPFIDQSKHFHFTNFKEFVANAYKNSERTNIARESTKDTSRLPS